VNHSPSSEGGFTLIEVMVATGILGFVMSALVAMLIMLLNTAPVTDAIYSHSQDAQMLAAYWGTDVQSSDDVNNVAGNNDFQCLDSGGGTNPLVQFRWTTRDGTLSVKVASYQTKTVGPVGFQNLQVVRTFCVNGSQHATSIIIHGLDPGAPPGIACDPDARCTFSADAGVSADTRTFSYFVHGSRRTT
jgi:prepilin-type N-terminal cleavage/methylation domain-containing protein